MEIIRNISHETYRGEDQVAKISKNISSASRISILWSSSETCILND